MAALPLLILFVGLAECQLQLSPSDVIMARGQNLSLRCKTLAGNNLRWFMRETYNDYYVFYNGNEMYRDLVDSRFSVLNEGNGSFVLNIQNVTFDDARVYGCHDPAAGYKTYANVDVIDPSSPQVIRNVLSATIVEHRCSFIYRGPLTPQIEWIDNSGHVMKVTERLNSMSGRGVESTFNVPLEDMPVWPYTCQVKFKLHLSNFTVVSSDFFEYERSLSGYWNTYWMYAVTLLIGVFLGIMLSLVAAVFKSMRQTKPEQPEHDQSEASSQEPLVDQVYVPNNISADEKQPVPVYQGLHFTDDPMPYAALNRGYANV